MAYFPTNDRSELISRNSPGELRSMKSGDGGVFDTSRRFQAASPAFIHPARRLRRGSGDGSAVDRCRLTATPPPAQAVRASRRIGRMGKTLTEDSGGGM